MTPFNKSFTPNPAQLRAMMVDAPITVNIWGRGQGKTWNLAQKIVRVVHLFPRGSSVLQGKTYVNIRMLILPQIVGALESLGYYENVHFIVGHKPLPKHGFATPIFRPFIYEFTISWYNGHVIYLASQDRKGSFRGPSIDYVFADELLTLDKTKFEQETLAANRGNKSIFGHIHLHHGQHLSSSKPIGINDKWILEAAQYYTDAGKNYDILLDEITNLELEIIQNYEDDNKVKKLWHQIKLLNKEIIYFTSSEGVFYNETRFWNNIKNLGWKWLRDEYRSMSLLEFKVEILNATLKLIGNSFYPTFKELKHVYYDSFNYTHIDLLTKTAKQNSQWDEDCNSAEPLIVGLDVGADINFMVIAQRNGSELRILNEIFVKHPLHTSDLVKLFCDYYAHHSCKYVVLYPDHTVFNRNPNSPPLINDVVRILNENGWTAEPRRYGDPQDTMLRYNNAYKVFEEQIPGQMYIRMNGNNCKNLITSIKLSPVIQGTKGAKKDKSSEGKSNIPQEIATHGSDTLDFVLNGEYNQTVQTSFIDAMFT